MIDSNPFRVYTKEEQPERQQFLEEHPDRVCSDNGRPHGHVIGDIFNFRATGCCWVCGKAVA